MAFTAVGTSGHETRELLIPQVELASLDYQKTRLVRALGKDGTRLGFGEGGAAEVVSARGYVFHFLFACLTIGELSDKLGPFSKIDRTTDLY